MRPTVLTEHPVFLERVAAALEAAVAVTEGGRQCPLTPFDSVAIPNQSLAAYVRRMGRRFRCGREVFTLALVYCERAAAAGIPCRGTSAHRLYLSALVLAAKFLEDGAPGNEFFAKCGGISAKELCFLEHRCLEALGYRLHVDRDCFKACDSALTTALCNSDVVLAALADAAAAKGLAVDEADAEPSTGCCGVDDTDNVVDKTLPVAQDTDNVETPCLDLDKQSEFSESSSYEQTSSPALSEEGTEVRKDAPSPQQHCTGCCRRDHVRARAMPRRRHRQGRRFADYGGA